MSEQAPRLVRKAIGLTVATPKQEQQGFRRRVLDLMLQSVQVGRIRHARITNNGVRAEAETACGGNEPATPICKTVAIAFYWNRRDRHQMIWTLQIREAREVHGLTIIGIVCENSKLSSHPARIRMMSPFADPLRFDAHRRLPLSVPERAPAAGVRLGLGFLFKATWRR
jgi:hypothetical protein